MSEYNATGFLTSVHDVFQKLRGKAKTFKGFPAGKKGLQNEPNTVGEEAPGDMHDDQSTLPVVVKFADSRLGQVATESSVQAGVQSSRPGNHIALDSALHPPQEPLRTAASRRQERGLAAISKFRGYKLESDIRKDYVVHKHEVSAGVWEESIWDDEKDIGRRGASSVWCQKKRGVEGGQLRAVKTLPQHSLPMVARELLAFATLKDYGQFFVSFFGWYEDTRYIFIAMEYMEHGDLGRYIARCPLDASTNAKEITKQILQGLEVLHMKRICHRDLKPPNILIASLDPIRVKIADFGVSKSLEATTARTGWRTDNYRAPEILRILPQALQNQRIIGYALDIWSLGSLVHELLTSQTPFLKLIEDFDSERESDEEFGIIVDINNNLQPKHTFDTISCERYCKGMGFPTQVLEEFRVSKAGIDFVKKLLVPNPGDRPTATCALKYPWLEEPNLLEDQRPLAATSATKHIPLDRHTDNSIEESIMPVSSIDHAVQLQDPGVQPDTRSDLLGSSSIAGTFSSQADRHRMLDGYKLGTEFHDDYVVHTTYKWDLSTRLWEESIWRQEKIVGEGTFAVVWLQREQKRGELRAVKELKKEPSFQSLLLVLIKLSYHDDLFIRLLGWYEDKYSIFIAMEYAEDGDLAGYLRRDPTGAKKSAKEITRQLLKGIEVLHEERVCHRDINPSNVLIASLDPIRVKITGFTCSKWVKDTCARTLCGTQGYMAPENLGVLPRRLVRGGLLPHAMDIWSLGSMLHQILTSKLPFSRPYDEDSPAESDLEDLSGLEDSWNSIDIAKLLEYCRGSMGFPAESLQCSLVDEEGIQFVKSLLAPYPEERPTASIALQHPWLGLEGENNTLSDGRGQTGALGNQGQPQSDKHTFT